MYVCLLARVFECLFFIVSECFCVNVCEGLSMWLFLCVWVRFQLYICERVCVCLCLTVLFMRLFSKVCLYASAFFKCVSVDNCLSEYLCLIFFGLCLFCECLFTCAFLFFCALFGVFLLVCLNMFDCMYFCPH